MATNRAPIRRSFAPRLFYVGSVLIHPAANRPDFWVATFPGGDRVCCDKSFRKVVRTARRFEHLA